MVPRDALAVFVEELIPSDDLPGAAEAETGTALRRWLEQRPALAGLVEQGMQAVERASQQLTGQGFAALPSVQRQHLMAMLARGSPPPGWTAADPRPEVFWSTVRSLAMALFYSGPFGQ